MDLGMTLAFPTLVISALLKSEGKLHFDDAAASWFGKNDVTILVPGVSLNFYGYVSTIKL